jgi:hypothetical protein
VRKRLVDLLILFVFLVIALMIALPLIAQEPVKLGYTGGWVDTGLPTDGPMSAGVEELGEGRWRARFTGIWQGAKFDETVEFTGTRDALKGEAKVNAAKYVWAGKLNDDEFVGSYRSNRGHLGTWRMKRVK